MIDTQTIKCPNCGQDTHLPANQPLYISISEDIKCPNCGQIIIKSSTPTY